jgi:hypothetical protein
VGRDGRFPAPKLAPHTAVISPSCFSLGGGRRGVQYEYGGGDKENIPQDEDDEDGPILYRDDGEMEDEGERRLVGLRVLQCVPSSELGPSHPLSCQRVCLSPEQKGGGAHSPAGEGVGES